MSPIRVVLSFICFISLLSCSSGHQDTFAPGDIYTDTARPWSHLNFKNDPGNFQFAIVTDRTGSHRPGVFAGMLGKLNLLQPEFVMSVGDYVEGYTDNEEVIQLQWQEIDNIIADLDAPFFYVPGNHDLWPGKENTTHMATAWQQRNGRSYYHFVYGNALFMVLNTEDPAPQRTPESDAAFRQLFETMRTSGAQAAEKFLWQSEALQGEMGTIGDTQTEYLLQTLAANTEVRWTFLFMHRPIFNRTTDNNFKRVEAALKGRKYTMFAGHEHHYRYLRRHGNDYMQLGTTGGGWNSARTPEPNRKDDGLSEMDHITWVTMRDDAQGGPQFAHILGTGIMAKDNVPDYMPGAEYCGKHHNIECVFSDSTD